MDTVRVSSRERSPSYLLSHPSTTNVTTFPVDSTVTVTALRAKRSECKVFCVSITQNRKGSLAQHNMRSFGHCWRGVPAVPPVNLSIGLVHQLHLRRRANVTTRHQERVDPTRCKLPPVKRRKRSLRTSQRASGLLCRHQCAQRARLSAVVQMRSCVSATCGLQIDASRCAHKYMGGQE